MMGINAVKGVEIGAGFARGGAVAARRTPTRCACRTARSRFLSNQAGGILGGISTGQDIVVRFAVKPTSSILHAAQDRRRRTATRPRSSTKGRHDPCVGIRAVPVGEAMMALRAGRPPAAPSRAVRVNGCKTYRAAPISQGLDGLGVNQFALR